MASIDELSQKKNVRPNTIVRALCRDHFAGLKWVFIHARYNPKPLLHHPAEITYFHFDFPPSESHIVIDPIYRTAKTSALIGVIAHELAHIELFRVLKADQKLKYSEEVAERKADEIVITRGLGKHLYEEKAFTESLPSERYGFPSEKMVSVGISIDELTRFCDR